jgi:predicted enzyme related to lactoylglutathione lyase
MTPEFKGLRTAIYKVSDLARATDWYSKVLGTPPYFNEPFYVGFNVAGYELGLQPEDFVSEKVATVLTYWGVDDVQQTFQRLITLGASEFEGPTDVGGGIVVAAVQDPWGNIFGIIHNPSFKVKN